MGLESHSQATVQVASIGQPPGSLRHAGLKRYPGPIYEPAAPAGPPRMREACGVIAIYGTNDDVAIQTYFALYAVQHRGQESAGIVVGDGRELQSVKGMGLISGVFKPDQLEGLRGHLAIGHCRYSTMGSNRDENVQPVLQATDLGPFAIGHNGNIVNALELSGTASLNGEQVQATTDTAVIGRLIADAPGAGIAERVQRVVPRLQGSFCLVIATPTEIIAARDGMGNRPLSIGRVNGTWMLASETSALDTIGAVFERDVRPGEIIVIDAQGLRSTQLDLPVRRATCAFEYIYFSRPDSVVEGAHVHSVRRHMGRLLAEQRPVEADLVVGVPDSAVAAATGYAEASGLVYTDGFVRNRYIGRTFIEPTSQLRKLGARLKYNALPEVTGGKRVVMVDDSIVRGTTQTQLVALLREQGEAAEVHVRITSPPIRWPCFLGIDIPDPKELIAHELDPDAIRDQINADSLEYLTTDNLLTAIDRSREHLCLGCFNRDYPIDVQLGFDKFALEQPRGLETAPVFPRQSTLLRPDSEREVVE